MWVSSRLAIRFVGGRAFLALSEEEAARRIRRSLLFSATREPCPLCPRKRHPMRQYGMSVKGQKRTFSLPRAGAAPRIARRVARLRGRVGLFRQRGLFSISVRECHRALLAPKAFGVGAAYRRVPASAVPVAGRRVHRCNGAFAC